MELEKSSNSQKYYETNKFKNFKMKIVRPRKIFYDSPEDEMKYIYKRNLDSTKASLINDHFHFRGQPAVKMKLKTYAPEDQNKKFEFKNIVKQHKVFQNERVNI